ncbi:hypothetical protein M514_08837 [Trichuris suis]|uniref:Uncharacterized protein n=1 Tax=Trichuris suis TaxID=68888 RepID=A0A085NJ54_9BILA|nr:hypothetical protein M513_08837 [Trichuris suis]KFD69500.1 hypothetical protein M514_08837 [Trichuris suis]
MSNECDNLVKTWLVYDGEDKIFQTLRADKRRSASIRRARDTRGEQEEKEDDDDDDEVEECQTLRIKVLIPSSR